MTVPTYRPVLLTKDGELQAVSDLGPEALPLLAPIFAVHPPTTYRSPNEHVDAVALKVAERVPGSSVSLDTSFVDVDHDGTATHSLISASETLETTLGLALVPVVTRPAGSSQASAAAEVQRRHGAGVVVRLPVHAAGPLIEAATNLDRLVDDLDVQPSDVDLVLDAADAEDVDADIATELVGAAMEPDPDGTRWRSVTLTASSFLRGVRTFARNEVSRLPRRDWQLWAAVAERQTSAALPVPDFGDYGIVDPGAPDTTDPRFTSISTALRYSVDDDWLVAKGDVFNDGRGDPAGKVVQVARMIHEHPEFKGSAFSTGDRWIAEIATGRSAETGNATRWRRAGTNHHISLVTTSLASSYGP